MLQPQILDYGSMMDQFPEFQRLKKGISRLMSAIDVPYCPDFTAVNVWSGQDDAVITAELPGIDPGKLDISVTGNILKISGSREPEAVRNGDGYYRRERFCGPFTRTLQLSFQADAARVDAKYEKGILQITVPRAESDKPKKIPVRKD